MSNAVQAHKEPTEVAPRAEGDAIISMIERAARDPNVDVDKMERLLQMQERVAAMRAKAEYAAALSEMQMELPEIKQRGKIEIRGAVQSTYAKWEDINDAIRPVLSKHGFALSFRTGSRDGKIVVTGVLSHRAGHSEETTIELPTDTSGSKNSVQAVGSSTSYGKRYTASALLNLTSRGEDDDGKAGGTDTTITDEQAATLRKALEFVGADEGRFCAHIKVERLEDILAGKFDDALRLINSKRKAQ